MIENGKATIIASLRDKYPNDSDDDIFVKMVRVLYKNDLSPEFLNAFEKKFREREKGV